VWKIRYALTDDSAAEQRAINFAFTEQDNEKFGNVFGEVEHLRRWHCKQTLIDNYMEISWQMQINT
jgi:hypothetical protein